MNNKIVMLENREIPFSEYLSSHPHLYDGVELTQGEIDYLNNEFWDLNVKERGFQEHYIQAIRKYIAQYKNAKAIEFHERIFNITTNHNISHAVNKVAGHDSGNNRHSGTNTTQIGQRHSTDTNKNANRALPMKSTGTTFDGTVSWGGGASGIAETHNELTNDQATDQITYGDRTDLERWNDRNSDLWQDNEGVNAQAVLLIARIWDYLLQPKALEWFSNKLMNCFILVY